VKTSYSASPSTLTILSKYCGFNSLDELENISSSPRTDSSVNTEEVFQYLVSLFKNFPVGEIFNPVMTSIVQQTVSFLERNSSLIERFQREVAGTPAGQYYYFERSVNMDRLNGYYGEGLRYYLRAKNNNEARVFTYSLQVFRYWLSNDAELIEKNMAALASVSMTINYPSHILARYIAARLYYANYKADIPDKILADAAKYYAAINARSETPDPDFDLIVGEALILTNHVAEGSEYIRRGKSKLAGLPGSTGTENFFNTWEKILNSRKNTLSKVITSPLKSNRSSYIYTSPLNKRYFNLVRLSADSKAKKNNVPELLRETGFIRLSC
jgi:hypothetical protein